MADQKRILFISPKKFPIQKIQQYFEAEYQDTYDIQLFATFGEAEGCFFDPDYTICLLIADFREPSLFDNVRMLRDDEVFRFLPILGILPEIDSVSLPALLSCGCESYLAEAQLRSSLINYMHLLLLRANNLQDISLKVSQLQEKAIRDFILLDIIKNYIPRTIWYKAEDFAQKQRLELNSEETELVICFADICRFSTLSQYKQPKEVVEMLNIVFEVATRYIFSFGGDIDKFIGDAFLAIFSDLEPAIKAMYGIQQELRQINQSNRQQGLDVVQFRIGMHIGKIIRGNVGGNDRFDNTLIGDTVNAASRLEGKAPNGGFVISEAIRQRLRLEIPEEYRMSATLKGRAGEEVYYSMFDYLAAHPQTVANLQEDTAQVMAARGDSLSKLYQNFAKVKED